ncbi:hypothetical protein PIB30_028724 [Stylosanthes scabra]|uniref:Uncharacterized protein n=1 Tax=Stylosanthes scabra TaxID=79078 RepID=A0ABU6V9Y5_9FABA|nr:hypothetical protein [Stylosanthes scabra]
MVAHLVPGHINTRKISVLDLEAMAPSQEENDASVGFGGGGSMDVLMPKEFEICQVFQTKEDAVLSVKSYNIHRGVEYKERVLRSEKVQQCIRFPGYRGLKRPPLARLPRDMCLHNDHGAG